MRSVMDDWDGSVVFGGRKITNLRYVDDTVIMATSQDELRAIDRVKF